MVSTTEIKLIQFNQLGGMCGKNSDNVHVCLCAGTRGHARAMKDMTVICLYCVAFALERLKCRSQNVSSDVQACMNKKNCRSLPTRAHRDGSRVAILQMKPRNLPTIYYPFP